MQGKNSKSDTKQALVLLHGWAMNSTVWKPLLPYLQDNFCIYPIELPGHGMSAKDAVGDTLLDWAEAVLVCAPENAIWLGWSLGGMLALQIAEQYPARVAGLILTGSSPCFVRKENWTGAIELRVLNEFQKMLLEDKHSLINRFLALQTLGADDALQTRRYLKQVFEVTDKPSDRALIKGLMFLASCDLMSAFKCLSCPVALILGTEDKLVPITLRGDLRNMNSAVKLAVIQGAGHAAFVSHPAEFATEVMALSR